MALRPCILHLLQARACGLSQDSALELSGGNDLFDAGDAVVEEVRDPLLCLLRVRRNRRGSQA